ncbi:orotate phosphoribosyltransferase [Methanomicrobiaceae archaeon CYW5]|uniref:orotate phosphoribosyltransferase n=1 Tax=Methanovulcanius yangii TaxID=1789227 RepID=UPI0029C9B67E|nr:orotate phosphoribosyltransferase [Methanovulcanius yangii]MBT8507676.1 orotate phosphoribosyltransferase [Methanovulcanius yangii]
MVTSIQELLIESGAIRFGDFTLASGAKSTYYVDIKTAATDPGLLGAIGAAIADAAVFEVVAGVAVGAVPIAVATALSSGKPYAVIRKAGKGYGLSEMIIGDVSGKKVLLVEDVTTSGGSVLYGIETLRKAGATVVGVVTVVDREQGAKAALKDVGVPLIPLVRISEILD